MVEVNCETDFVAKNESFIEFTSDVSMQIAAMGAQYVKREDVPESVIEAERKIRIEVGRGLEGTITDSISGHWGDRPFEDLQKGLAAALERYPWMDGDRVAALRKISVPTLVIHGDDDYPPLLATVPDAPAALRVRGTLPGSADLALAIVGARRASAYGLDQAARFAQRLGAAGLVIVYAAFYFLIDANALRYPILLTPELNPNVAEAAAISLGRTTDDRAGTALLGAMKAKPQLRDSIIDEVFISYPRETEFQRQLRRRPNHPDCRVCEPGGSPPSPRTAGPALPPFLDIQHVLARHLRPGGHKRSGHHR